MTKGQNSQKNEFCPFLCTSISNKIFIKSHQLSNQTCHQKSHNIYRYDSRSNWGSAQDGNDNPKKGTHN